MPYSYKYSRPALSVDCVVFGVDSETLKVLLIQRAQSPFQGQWALPGGFVEMNETVAEAARRELEEETGLTNVFLEQLYTFSAVERDPRERVVSVAHYALVRMSDHKAQAATDAADADWFPADDAPHLAFDHADILAYALRRLRYKLEYRAVAFQLLPETFTLTELQEAYEHILNEQLDKRNFRRKVLAAGIVEETPYVRGGVHRPAKLYCFRPDAVAEIKARRLFP